MNDVACEYNSETHEYSIIVCSISLLQSFLGGQKNTIHTYYDFLKGFLRLFEVVHSVSDRLFHLPGYNFGVIHDASEKF